MKNNSARSHCDHIRYRLDGLYTGDPGLSPVSDQTSVMTTTLNKLHKKANLPEHTTYFNNENRIFFYTSLTVHVSTYTKSTANSQLACSSCTCVRGRNSPHHQVAVIYICHSKRETGRLRTADN